MRKKKTKTQRQLIKSPRVTKDNYIVRIFFFFSTMKLLKWVHAQYSDWDGKKHMCSVWLQFSKWWWAGSVLSILLPHTANAKQRRPKWYMCVCVWLCIDKQLLPHVAYRKGLTRTEEKKGMGEGRRKTKQRTPIMVCWIEYAKQERESEKALAIHCMLCELATKTPLNREDTTIWFQLWYIYASVSVVNWQKRNEMKEKTSNMPWNYVRKIRLEIKREQEIPKFLMRAWVARCVEYKSA